MNIITLRLTVSHICPLSLRHSQQSAGFRYDVSEGEKPPRSQNCSRCRNDGLPYANPGCYKSQKISLRHGESAPPPPSDLGRGSLVLIFHAIFNINNVYSSNVFNKMIQTWESARPVNHRATPS